MPLLLGPTSPSEVESALDTPNSCCCCWYCAMSILLLAPPEKEVPPAYTAVTTTRTGDTAVASPTSVVLTAEAMAAATASRSACDRGVVMDREK